MVPWIILSLVLCVVGAVLTIIWWRVGDIWADEEHKRFKGSDDSETASGATVIKSFDSPAHDDGDPPS